jgi:hypothetical protein
MFDFSAVAASSTLVANIPVELVGLHGPLLLPNHGRRICIRLYEVDVVMSS